MELINIVTVEDVREGGKGVVGELWEISVLLQDNYKSD